MGSCCSAHTIDFYSNRLDEIPISLNGTEKKCYVKDCVDGDTLTIAYLHPTMTRGKFENIQVRRFRLYGIDSPELHSKNLKEKEEGLKAKKFLEQLILHKVVNIKFSKEEKFGRLMGIITFKGEDINQKMILSGNARPYFGQKKEPWKFND